MPKIAHFGRGFLLSDAHFSGYRLIASGHEQGHGPGVAKRGGWSELSRGKEFVRVYMLAGLDDFSEPFFYCIKFNFQIKDFLYGLDKNLDLRVSTSLR